MERMYGGPLPFRKSNDHSIDTLYGTARFVADNEFFGTIPEDRLGEEVAVIGFGISGGATAAELMKVGLKPVIFDLDSEPRGRLDSREFLDEKGNPVGVIADLGAMRISVHSRLLWHYANLFGIEPTERAPVPGTVGGKIYFDGVVYDCPAGETVPKHPLLLVGNLRAHAGVSCAVIKHVGGTVAENSPLTQKRDLYQYV